MFPALFDFQIPNHVVFPYLTNPSSDLFPNETLDSLVNRDLSTSSFSNSTITTPNKFGSYGYN